MVPRIAVRQGRSHPGRGRRKETAALRVRVVGFAAAPAAFFASRDDDEVEDADPVLLTLFALPPPLAPEPVAGPDNFARFTFSFSFSRCSSVSAQSLR